MNKVIKTANLIAFTAMLSVFSVKPASADFLSKVIGKATDEAVKSAVKTAAKSIESKGPTKEIQITDIPSEYEGHFAMIMASLPDDAKNICVPSYLTLETIGSAKEVVIDTVSAGAVTITTPCDDQKRLIVLTLSKTRDKDTTSAGGFIYAKDAGGDVCKSKAAMPIYKLSEKQTFSFKNFMSNETCKKIADGVAKAKK